MDAFREGDYDGVFGCFHPDVVLDLSAWDFPGADVYHGHEGVREFWRHWAGTWEEYRAQPREFIAVGDAVLIPMHVRARSRGSGIEVEGVFVDALTFRDGKVVRYEVFSDEAGARAAFGLS